MNAITIFAPIFNCFPKDGQASVKKVLNNLFYKYAYYQYQMHEQYNTKQEMVVKETEITNKNEYKYN